MGATSSVDTGPRGARGVRGYDRGDHGTRRARGPIHRVLAGVVVMGAVLLGVLPTAGAAPSTPAESAEAGSLWIADQLEIGIPLDLFGSPDWGVTIDAATALAAVDASDPLIDLVWAEIEADRDDIVSDGAADVPGTLAKLVLLAHSTGRDPHAVGSGAGADLVARLADTLQPSGLYGIQFAGYDGVYRQGLAITALVSAGAAPDPAAISWLITQQCTNPGFEGAYMPYRADTSVDCEDDPGSWLGADTNAAAMVVTALTYAAADDPDATADDPDATAAIESALDWLASVRDPEGGWASNSWSSPDANSTAVVIQALIAAGELGADRFSGGVRTPQQFLMTLQIDEADEPSDLGAFNFMAGPDDPNLLATVQAVVAQASQPLIFEGPVPTAPGDATTTTTTSVSVGTDPAEGGFPVGSSGMGPTGVGERGIAFAG